jgi:hypothetical protein
MQLKRSNSSWFRVTVLTWAALWMLAAPLVHIHPEADHRHGDPDHVHGGTVHTVFSPDLSCEFSRYDHAPAAATESHCPLHLIAQPLHGAEHLEIDFVFASSAAPQVGKGTALDVAAHSFYANQPLRPPAQWQPQPSPWLTKPFLSTSLPSRAPPSM